MPDNTTDDYRKCPLCGDGPLKGRGVRYAQHAKGSLLTRRYYKCDQCGHTWHQDFRPAQPIIEHREPVIETQEAPQTETREAPSLPRSKPRRNR